ncbi:GGDEF domain-containing protein [Pseudoduganella violacea]|uniref:diguanylate cyclase n=1 Tax=Pseudoduganella violacea TaxID=1715466 RepID=A0A7W5FT86_9BURK|nr:GGDEF domain-containing protein [Pseudoduganella violacea]MBB3118326.1 diguanylate cyclase (GGDEF)-like protein [Pseudoduganella violacea]
MKQALWPPAENAADATLNHLSSEFRDPAMEQAFLRHHLRLSQRQLRMTFCFCAFFYLAFVLSDVAWLGYSGLTLMLFCARIGVVTCALFGLLAIRLRPNSVALTRAVATLVELAGTAVFLLIVAFRPSEFAGHAISMTIVIMVLYVYVPNRLLHAAAIALPATLVFVLMARHRQDIEALGLVTMGLLLLLANLLGYVTARRYQLLWREEFRTQTELKIQSLRDPLTGCFNRRHLHEQLMENEIMRAQRYRLSLAVIMCDLDHFKRVNDEYGHAAGDAVLQAFSRLLLAMTRENVDSVVRYGGEEFLLILPETGLEGATLLAERLRRRFEESTVRFEGHNLQATASFGVVTADFADGAQALRPEESSQYSLIAKADELLYAAKNGGRNQVRAQALS